MSIDLLQERIRKLKNPSVIDFSIPEIPAQIADEIEEPGEAIQKYYMDLLEGLKDIVPAVRFHYLTFAFLEKPIDVLMSVLTKARELGYFVFLDLPGVSSQAEAEHLASKLGESPVTELYDCLIVQPYLGSDGVKPFIQIAKKTEKSVFVLSRTPNKSAVEIQDLLSGTRVVHQVIVESVKRFGENRIGKCHYNEIGAVISATNGSGIRSLRASFPEVFFLMDGLDVIGGNASNCSKGFDRFGHGAAACAGGSIINAWKENEGGETDYVAAAIAAAERMKKNLTRYTTVM